MLTSAEAIEARIRSLLASRAETASICPSEVARSLSPERWRQLMEPVREAARRMADSGDVEITRRGEPVDAREAKGPIRIRKRRSE